MHSRILAAVTGLIRSQVILAISSKWNLNIVVRVSNEPTSTDVITATSIIPKKLSGNSKLAST